MTSITEQRNDQMANSPEQTDQLMDYLLATHKLEDLQASLLNSLSTCGWTERVRNLAFELFEQKTTVALKMCATHGAGEVTVKKETAEGSNSIPENGPLASCGSSASDIVAHYNVQIPERAVNSGVKFLQDSMHELFSSDTEDQPNGTRGHDPESDDDIPIAKKEMKKKASDQPKTNGHPLPKSNT
ncbi:hypothetical protein TESG_04890 [Trichophyton tonsurans CBS 112818]|uniref:Uncharacterized protein n=1 Tax=Trichophyton tonsurans (strain CBS 112818) TaxID=647933 RepID=F2S1N3_TRIT1|nr:hypothetical protein TESG_04890 [Trichophyton tonsurans CBS 112818]